MRHNRCIKFTFFVFIIIIMSCFSACTSRTGLDDDNYEPHADENIAINETTEQYHPTVNAPGDDSQANELSTNQLMRQDFMDDFDYMMDVLENNFLYFDIIERRLGLCLRELAGATRAVIADESVYMNPRIFWDIMQENFFAPINLVGHLRIFDDNQYHLRYNMINEYHPNWLALNSPNTLTFYGEPQMTPQQIMAGIRGGGANIEFESVEEGRIAVMRIHSMMADDLVADVLMAIEYYNHFADYEHLIIDIRGNPGGGASYFPVIVLGVFTEEAFEVPMYALFSVDFESLAQMWLEVDMDGMPYLHNRELFNHGVNSPIRIDLTEDLWRLETPVTEPEEFGEGWVRVVGDEATGEIRMFMVDAYGNEVPVEPEDVFTVSYDEPEFAEHADHTSVEIMEVVNPLPEGIFDNIFGGKLWLLIDGMTYSAGEHATIASLASGFITVVGEQTRGGMGTGMYRYVSMPNSGIVFMFDVGVNVDSYGRAFEEFPALPHYFNRTGLNALETTLQLIAEK